MHELLGHRVLHNCHGGARSSCHALHRCYTADALLCRNTAKVYCGTQERGGRAPSRDWWWSSVRDYTLATKCPHCGGRLMLSEFMSYSRDSLIRKIGQPCKRWSKSPEGSMDAIAVSCMECGTVWAHPAGYAFAAGLRVGKAHEVQRHVHRAQPRRRGVDAPAHLPVKAVQNDLGLAGMFNGKSAQKNSPFGSAAKRQTVGHMPVQTGGAQARGTRRI